MHSGYGEFEEFCAKSSTYNYIGDPAAWVLPGWGPRICLSSDSQFTATLLASI